MCQLLNNDVVGTVLNALNCAVSKKLFFRLRVRLKNYFITFEIELKSGKLLLLQNDQMYNLSF